MTWHLFPDILNELASTPLETPVQQRPDPRRQAAAARHLSKYIFPRQYDLPNVFNGADNGAYVIEDRQREAQIKVDIGVLFEFLFTFEMKARGNCKTPKRLKTALELLDQLLWRHSKCGYKPLLQRLCPSKVRPRNMVPELTKVILFCNRLEPTSKSHLMRLLY
jgi:telomerase reverse transcriptase